MKDILIILFDLAAVAWFLWRFNELKSDDKKPWLYLLLSAGFFALFVLKLYTLLLA